MPTIDELMKGKQPGSVVLQDTKGSIVGRFTPYYCIKGHWHGPSDGSSHYSLSGSEDRWELYTEPKKLWRRPVKDSGGRINYDACWYPSKEEFMTGWPSYTIFGPWESRDDDIEWSKD